MENGSKGGEGVRGCGARSQRGIRRKERAIMSSKLPGIRLGHREWTLCEGTLGRRSIRARRRLSPAIFMLVTPVPQVVSVLMENSKEDPMSN